mgnify:CR=1 FL=1|jgi:hypothetical protein
MSKVDKLPVGWGTRELFSENFEYIVPMYQRDFAWGEKEIKTLLTDIELFNAPEYYLGSLVVSKTSSENGKDCFEVIDGQQRLTALFMTLSIVDSFNKKNSGKSDFNLRGDAPIRYECRDRTERFFKKIKEIPFAEFIKDDWDLENKDHEIEVGAIENAFNEIKKYFKINPESERVSQECIDKIISFNKRLQKVKMLRVEVPEGTNLNRYYERMNTRSEQLEQSDILKSKLMGQIEAKQGREFFSKIWNACADMDHYVQMGFIKETRERIFGQEWDKLNVEKLENELNNPSGAGKSENNSDIVSIDEIISKEMKNTVDAKVNVVDDSRFESIISFPVFLIHAYKVYVKHHVKCSDETVSEMDPKDLNEAKLVDIFKLSTWNEDSAKGFIKTLICLRFLFDKFFIKRDFSDKPSKISDEGSWSLLSLHSIDDGKHQSYVNTRDGEDKNSDDDAKNKRCLMIQACLRVSYTAPRSMHWITCLLDEIYTRYLTAGYNLSAILIDNVTKCCERIAAKAVKNDFLDCRFKKPDGSFSQYRMGVWTPHLVFHFLDYLLWSNPQSELKDTEFDFKFRNSVEHWHPQNFDIHFVGKWNEKELEDGLDGFGNLGIVTTSANSKLSNLAPSTKATDRKDIIEQGSLKLRLMRDITIKNGWTYQESKKHQDEMIRLLSESCEKILSVSVH